MLGNGGINLVRPRCALDPKLLETFRATGRIARLRLLALRASPLALVLADESPKLFPTLSVLIRGDNILDWTDVLK
jgi:hypothetical protein